MTSCGVPADDRGLTLGVGLFETLPFVAGEPRLWDAHVRRLQRGCAELGLPAPAPDTLLDAAGRAVDGAGLAHGRAAVRLTWTGGSGPRGLVEPPVAQPRLLATAAPAAKPLLAYSLQTSHVRRNPTSPASRLKTLNYLDNVLARRDAVAAGADEALCLDTSGRVACAAAANLFWLEGERLCTPALSCGVLDGVIRAEVLRHAPAVGLIPIAVEAGPDRLHRSDGVFLTNSLIGLAPVRSLDGQPLPEPTAVIWNLNCLISL